MSERPRGSTSERSHDDDTSNDLHSSAAGMTSTLQDGVRQLRMDDIPALLALASDEIPDTMAARLGPRFAERYHHALLEEPTLRLDGCFVGGELVGFIVYSHDAREALRSAFARHRFTFAFALCVTFFSPRQVAYLIRIAITVLGSAAEPGADVPAELLTIAVRRKLRGAAAQSRERRMNVPHELITGAFEYLRARGIKQVKVFCKPEEVEPIANGFVRKEGFVFRERGTRYGIPTNLYVRALDGAQQGA